MDGACAVYSLMMTLLMLNVVSRNQVEDVYDTIKKSAEVEKLFKEFFYKHGLVRGGFYFKELKNSLIKHSLLSYILSVLMKTTLIRMMFKQNLQRR